MNAFAKIITYTLVTGSLLIGLPSCKKKTKEEDPKYIQMVGTLEQMVSRCEITQPKFTERESKEVILNCLTDIKNMLEVFAPGYKLSEKEYGPVTDIIKTYSEITAADVANERHPDLGRMRKARGFTDTVREYASKSDCRKKPLEQIEIIEKITSQDEKKESTPNVCIDASRKCYELFESIEKAMKDDISYLKKTIEYAEKNNGKESELICKLAKIFQKEKESIKNKAEYYKGVFKQHSEILKKYFPSQPEEKSQDF